MPVDEFGNRAEIVVDSAPIVGRQILSRPYVQYTNASSREIRRRIREIAGWTAPMSIYEVEELGAERLDKIWEQIMLISNCLSGRQYEFYSALNQSDRNVVIQESLNNEVRLHIDTERPWHTRDRVTEDGMGLVETVRLMRKYIRPPRSRVTYTDSAGQRQTTDLPVRIAPLNWMVLEKTPDEYSAMATGGVQHMGILAPPGRSEKYRKPWRDRSVRTLCEVGVRIQGGHAGAAALVETQDRYNNPQTQEAMVRAIHEADNPAVVDNLVDRERYPFGGHRAYQVWLHMMNCMGINVRYVAPKFAVRRVNEQPNNHLEDKDVQ